MGGLSNLARNISKKFNSIFNKNKHLNREDSIVLHANTDSSFNEGFNRLKDNILYYSDNGKNKVIQIESSISGEGKTTVVCNLAVSLAENNKKVLVIDLDFRKPRVHRPFLIENVDGLGDYMTGDIDKSKLIKKTKYNVDVINRGKKIYNPSLVLTSDKFHSFMQEMRDEYDFIFVDCPPVLQISDYIHISKVTDGVLFVIASGKTKKSMVKEAVSLLKSNNSNIFGTVLTYTDAKGSNNYGYYNYYGKNYSYGYGDTEDEEVKTAPVNDSKTKKK